MTMRIVKLGQFTALTLLLSTSFAGAQNAGELQGYTPPPMFGSSIPQPKVQDMPVPAPVPQPAPLPAPALKPLPVPPATVPVQPPQPQAAPGPIRAEDLLRHPVTGEEPQLPVNPMAVPAAPVEKPESLPGSVPTAPKKQEPKKEPPKKEPPKKDVTKEIAPPRPDVKPDVKKAPPAEKPKPAPVPAPKDKNKQEPKPAAPKAKSGTTPPTPAKPVELKKSGTVETAPSFKKAEEKARKAAEAVVTEPPATKSPALPVPGSVKPEPKVTEAKAAPEVASPPAASQPLEKKKPEPYHPPGKKNMPSVPPVKVERSELDKTMLPSVDDVKVTTPPSKNEKIIDKALEDRLMHPDPNALATDAKDKSSAKPPVLRESVTPPPASAPAPLPDEPGPVKASLISLEFKKDLSELQPDQKRIIDTDILPKLAANKETRLQILAYASPSKEGQSSARRVSLSRGLALRSYMLEKGIVPSRMDIRALGENTNEKPVDRVDLVLVNPK